MTEGPPSSKLPWIIATVFGCLALILVLVLAGVVAILVARTPEPARALPAPPSAAPASTPRAGLVSGSVLDERGRPISVPGAAITVTVRGASTRGERQALHAPVDAKGHYELAPPDGNYHVECWLDLSFEGKRYRFVLDPTDGDPDSDLPVAKGIAKDFVWHLTGTIPRQDPAKYLGHYGGYIHFVSFLGTLPAESKLAFKLEPLTARVDGEPAAVATFELTRAALEANDFVGEWPLARYRLSGVATLPDGSTAPIRFDGYDYDKSKDSTEIVFGPGGAGITQNLDPVMVSVLGPGKH